ncbi:MAG: hypothetical protein Kow00108_27270 [Calditrichia bacterium]
MSFNIEENQLLPANRCLFCNKTIEEVGGNRIALNPFGGVYFSDKYLGGGNPKFPEKSVKLWDKTEQYIVLRFKKEHLTDELLEKAKQLVLFGKRPWFCQRCVGPSCQICGSPVNIPQGCTILYDDGCCSYLGILGISSGCNNPSCENFRDVRWGRNKK